MVLKYKPASKSLWYLSVKKLLLLFGMVFFLGQSCEVEEPTKDLKSKIAELEQSLDSLKNVNREIKAKLDSLLSIQPPEDQEWFDPNIHASRLLKQGINDPAQYIKQSLKERRELMPAEGVLGGNMAFRRMELLGQKWIIAEYDDGHIQGRSIYTYQWNAADNKIEFELLDSSSE